MRALGPRFDLARHDPSFRGAGRALAEIARLEPALTANEAAAGTRLARAHAALADFDRSLATLLGGLTHTILDGALLREVLAQVAKEVRAAGEVEVALEPVPAGIAVEMFRLDLRLVLANLIRNAL